MPILTVAITTFNRWELCPDVLKSVCVQEMEGMEVILVNDCSIEAMPEDVQSIVEANGVVSIRHETNQGLAAARNTAIKAASGKYFSFCDDDDQWPKGMARRLVDAMEHAPKGVGMGVGLSDVRKKPCKHLFLGYPRITKLMLKGFTPPVSSQIYLTSLLREVGGYTPGVKSGVDHDLWIKLARQDPKVTVSWGESAIVGSDLARKRMTTVESRRRSGIIESLQIWKPMIVEVFGQDFYRHFCKSYHQYLDYKFFVKDLRGANYGRAALRFFNFSVIMSFIKTIVYKTLSWKKCNLFPGYSKKKF